MKLIYVGDPMCSWCYGIAPEWNQVIETYEDKVDIELVMGGLRPYYNETMTSMKSFLSQHWEEVHEASGQEFSYEILDRADLVYDTEPPCRAVVVVRTMAPEKEALFFKMVQRDFYYNNKNMMDAKSYHSTLEALELSTEDFDTRFHSDFAKEAVKEDFSRARDLGVNSFPTILLEKNGELKVISRGYSKYQDLIKQIEKS